MKSDWRKTVYKAIKTAAVAAIGAGAVMLANDDSLAKLISEAPPWVAIIGMALATAIRNRYKVR